jgi:hypothetical protein
MHRVMPCKTFHLSCKSVVNLNQNLTHCLDWGHCRTDKRTEKFIIGREDGKHVGRQLSSDHVRLQDRIQWTQLFSPHLLISGAAILFIFFFHTPMCGATWSIDLCPKIGASHNGWCPQACNTIGSQVTSQVKSPKPTHSLFRGSD